MTVTASVGVGWELTPDGVLMQRAIVFTAHRRMQANEPPPDS
ncbi:hypothetical protein [Chloroflexus sp. Y-396-1]|nr:hypothetical protein [Chloroflexus sp. Y-396-1]